MEEMIMDGDPIRILPQEVVEAAQRLSVHKAHPSGDVFPLLFKKYTTTGGALGFARSGEKNKTRFRIIVVDWFGRKLLEKIICNRVEAIIEKKYI
eukprot:15439659-Heterocapsa_arctica.AAC.1